MGDLNVREQHFVLVFCFVGLLVTYCVVIFYEPNASETLYREQKRIQGLLLLPLPVHEACSPLELQSLFQNHGNGFVVGRGAALGNKMHHDHYCGTL